VCRPGYPTPEPAIRGRLVIIRHGDREARLMDDGGFWISFAGGERTVPMSSLVDDCENAKSMRLT
jgi:hypothetical protein